MGEFSDNISNILSSYYITFFEDADEIKNNERRQTDVTQNHLLFILYSIVPSFTLQMHLLFNIRKSTTL
jgi:hypothetical protein